MVNEIIQWAVLIVLSVLLLGVLRQTSLALPPEIRARETSGPPIGSQVSRKALSELRRAFPDLGNDDNLVAAFVTENCTGCQVLLARTEEHRDELAGKSFVVVAKRPSQSFRQALARTGLPFYADESGDVWRHFEVAATPLIAAIDPSGRLVGKEVSYSVYEFARSAWGITRSTSPGGA